MTEQFCTIGDGQRLCYRVTGEGAPILLIAGLALHLTSWPRAMVDGLAARGFRVIAFDNRDVGRSSRVATPPPSRLRLMFRRPGAEGYDLADMARDTTGLLDHLGIGAAHVVGMSMGGMIGQTVAALWPERAASLTSIFSNTGSLRAGQPAPSVILRLMQAPPRTREEAVARHLEIMRQIGGHGHPINEAALREYMEEAWDRGGPRPHEGSARQLAAIIRSGDRTKMLGAITAPTLVIHGDRDRMVHPSGGTATAAAIAGARHVTIEGMGHDIADGVVPRLVELIAEHAGGSRPCHSGGGS